MISGLYNAASGLLASQANQETVAQNLAHVNVPGFRRQLLAFEAMSKFSPDEQLQGTRTDQPTTDFTPGRMVYTGRPLDAAIQGDAFFVVQGDQGPLYTRNGAFHLNAKGELVTGDGRQVQGTGGPIVIPPEVSPLNLSIQPDGTVQFREFRYGQLKLASFADNQQLSRVGTTLFAAPPGVSPQDAGDASVMQGTREQANVTAVDELVRMIAGMRHYEASQKALTTLAEAISHNTNPQAS